MLMAPIYKASRMPAISLSNFEAVKSESLIVGNFGADNLYEHKRINPEKNFAGLI